MKSRTAIDTILGYFYQFDYTILELLNLSNGNDSVTVEGIEDIDISSATDETAVQCKYYAKTEYNHSVIAKPIRLMLDHYNDLKNGNKQFINYHLSGFYKSGQSKLTLPIDKTFLKDKLLTYTKDGLKHYHHVDLGLSDKDLDIFIERLTININSVSYEEQIQRIIDLLKDIFNCSKLTAEHCYYNNALNIIKEIATKSSISERIITKKEFLSRINNREILFNEWFILYKSKKEHLKAIRNEYFASLNTSPFERFFLIEIDNINYKRSELKELILLIIDKWTNISKRQPNPFCPYIYLHGISEEELIEIKRNFQAEGVNFLDGFDFSGASFSVKSITQTAKFENNIKIKILNSIDFLKTTLNEVKDTMEVYQFFFKQSYMTITDQNVKFVQIQVQNLKDIKEII